MDINSVWLLVCAAMVFLMQAGFLCLESGLSRSREAEIVALKNLFDWALTVPCFLMIGFGIMFGSSLGGLIGGSLFALNGLEEASNANVSPFVFVLFQLAFAGTAATIVFGSISGRASFPAYLASSVIMAILVYPVIGHWVWGDLLVASNAPWLAEMGFVDFAGSTVVHSTGGWFALVGAWLIGPRMGRFDLQGRPQPFQYNSFQTAGVGTMILWFGWWGFNGGSVLSADESAGRIVLNTNIAGAAGAIFATGHCWFIQSRRNLGPKVLGGAIGGLVAITASCHFATLPAAAAIGALAGLIHNYTYEALLHNAGIDDPVGAIPAHLACGIWGTLAVAIVHPEVTSFADLGRQFCIQLVGVVACAAWCCAVAASTIQIVRRFFGIRLTPDQERLGVNLSGSDFSNRSPDQDEALDPETLLKLIDGLDR